MSNPIQLVSLISPFAPQSGAQQRAALIYYALKSQDEAEPMTLEPAAEPVNGMNIAFNQAFDTPPNLPTKPFS